MSISETSICNLALSRFGGGKITSLDDDTTETARLLNLNYDNCLETVLREFPWNFARKIDILALTSNKTPGYNYVYAYPSGCMNLLRIYTAGNARLQCKVEFKIITDGDEKFIACDIEGACGEYTFKVITPNVYDSLFVKAFSYQLAAEICNAKTGNAQKTQEMLQKYQLSLGEAQLAGAIENCSKIEYPSSFLNSRGSRGMR